MTDQTAAIEVWARVLCAADAHVHGNPTWQQLPTAPGPFGRSQDDYRKVAAWLLPRMTVAAPAEQAPACADPIECGHEAALGQAREETRRLGLMVDEYGAGASALTDKLRRARERHRETCILARGEVKPTAFRCGLCEVLDAPAAPLRRMADEAQQPARHIPCPDAFWLRRPEAPHDWQQRPDAQPVHCPGVADTQQPKEA